MRVMLKSATVLILFVSVLPLQAENGHQLWLRQHSARPVTIVCSKQSATITIARQELEHGWQGRAGAIIVLTVGHDPSITRDGFKLDTLSVQANSDLGILYGVYDMLRRQATGQPLKGVISNPSYELRLLDHWDNLDGTIERGYAGRSIFWHDSIAVTDQDRLLWKEYARANASIGINGAVLSNVNASPQVLAQGILLKVKAIADVLRPYGIKTYLSVNFASPAVLGGLRTSDPLDADVRGWWKAKVEEIYSLIPDFGGFLMKANSEGEPGPQDFGRTHADGANMLADALKPHGGIVMWRAFVYSPQSKDRAKQAYEEFLPLDGQFRDNVVIQSKNGPVDFQPREPFSPIFGAMKKTPVMPELQITQEYLGQSKQLVFLSTMWEEFLNSDTFQHGRGSTVARCTDGSIFPQRHSAIAGVSNIGLDTNWCGHGFAQANWYAFGRLAWNNKLTSGTIAEEWLILTFSNSSETSNGEWRKHFLLPVKRMMLQSWEAAVNYMMPLGLHHIFAADHHYGPGPWYAPKDLRPDWTPPYYHKADTNGIGFDRTQTGSDAVSQYHEPLASQFNDLHTCPEKYLLWFHHVSWDYKIQPKADQPAAKKNGRTLWDELCHRYESGVQRVREFQKVWDRVRPYVDEQRFAEVREKLSIQYRDAQIWKDACLLYFQQFSKRPIPSDIEPPIYNLQQLESMDPRHPFPNNQ